MFVLKISVGGSGSYLENEIKSIIYESGAKEFSLCRSFDAPAATGRILAMPNVTFCNIEKRGSILHIDVQTDYEYDKTPQKSSLYADVNGTVKKITAVCGTPLVNVGDKVKKGDCLIAAFIVSGDKTVNSLAAGYVELESSGKSEYFAESESDRSLKDAYASVLIDEKDIISRKFTVKPAEGGVIYIIDFTYLHMLSINME